MIEVAIPSKLKIGGFVYSVESGDAVDVELQSRGLWGFHNNFYRKIQVRNKGTAQQLSHNLLHEIFHGIEESYAIDPVLSEHQIDAIGGGLTQIFEQAGIRFVIEEVQANGKTP